MSDGLPRRAPLRPGAVSPPLPAGSAGGPGRTSRHADLPTYRREVAGTEVVLFTPRLAPPPAPGSQPTYEVRPGDRLDMLAARLLGDPHQYWRIADENPEDLAALEEPGRELRIPGVS